MNEILAVTNGFKAQQRIMQMELVTERNLLPGMVALDFIKYYLYLLYVRERNWNASDIDMCNGMGMVRR